MTEDGEFAAELARRAGELLLELREGHGGDPVGLGNLADRASDDLLRGELAKRRPADAVLSEESAASPDRLRAERVWIIDPLDGTREYREGRSDWAVHVALCIGGVPTVGAVALPALGRVLSSASPPVRPARGGRPRIVVSRTRPPKELEPVVEALDAEVVPMGSAGAKTAAVILGEAEIYLHAGGQYEWDSAAPVSVAIAAGLHASRLDGRSLRYNQPDPYMPDLLVCLPHLARPILEALGH
jgi:3'(2'), 5'-bisphosphate nucleotidase